MHFHLPHHSAAAAAKSLQSCLTLCDPKDGSPPGSAIPGILQARTLEWVVIFFSNGWKWKWSRSVASDSANPWTAAYQAPPSMGVSRQEYRSGVPLPSPHHSAWSPKLYVIILYCQINHVPIITCSYNDLLYFLSSYWLWKLINIFYYCDYVTVL